MDGRGGGYRLMFFRRNIRTTIEMILSTREIVLSLFLIGFWGKSLISSRNGMDIFSK